MLHGNTACIIFVICTSYRRAFIWIMHVKVLAKSLNNIWKFGITLNKCAEYESFIRVNIPYILPVSLGDEEV